MSRAVMQQALEALEFVHRTGDTQAFDLCLADETIAALRAALAEPEQKVWCDCGDSIEPDTGAKCGNCVAADSAKPEQNPFGDDAERYARELHDERESYKALFTERKPQTTHWEGCEAVHPECRKPEPVTCMCREPWALERVHREKTPCFDYVERKPLTDAEMPTLFVGGLVLNSETTTEIVRAVEKAHGIGDSK